MCPRGDNQGSGRPAAVELLIKCCAEVPVKVSELVLESSVGVLPLAGRLKEAPKCLPRRLVSLGVPLLSSEGPEVGQVSETEPRSVTPREQQGSPPCPMETLTIAEGQAATSRCRI